MTIKVFKVSDLEWHVVDDATLEDYVDGYAYIKAEEDGDSERWMEWSIETCIWLKTLQPTRVVPFEEDDE